MDLAQIILSSFGALISGSIIYGVKEVGKMRESVELLNIKMATIIERTETHEKQIDGHDERIRDLEQRK